MTDQRTIRFNLNGRAVSTDVLPSETLLAVLESRFRLRGARESCGQGLCGCCTVNVDSEPVSACLYPAVFADGATIDTVEGLAKGQELDPVQQAFIDTGAFQCGFCTPGFVMMVKRLLRDNDNPTDDEISHYLVGNLCRCSAYPEILEAVKLAASRIAATGSKAGPANANGTP